LAEPFPWLYAASVPGRHPLPSGTADPCRFHLYLLGYVELGGQGFQICPDRGDQALAAETVQEVPDGNAAA
jgi:hypothetical protein